MGQCEKKHNYFVNALTRLQVYACIIEQHIFCTQMVRMNAYTHFLRSHAMPPCSLGAKSIDWDCYYTIEFPVPVR